LSGGVDLGIDNYRSIYCYIQNAAMLPEPGNENSTNCAA